MVSKRLSWFVALVGVVLSFGSSVATAEPLDPIQLGDIAVRLKPIATGMAAPDYGISPPNDTSRLFVVEQNGLLRLIKNGQLQSGVALDIQNLVQMAPIGTGPLNAGNANDERGFLGLAFHPGFNIPTSPGFQTLYTYTTEDVPGATPPIYGVPNNATRNFDMVIAEWKMSAANPDVVDPATRREVFSFGKNAGNHNGGT